MSLKRKQLSLFVPESLVQPIEMIRRRYNPAQYRLIKSHVTLCREDELEGLDQVLKNLSTMKQTAVPINFGNPLRFSEGKGLLLPAIGANEAFHALRSVILKGIIDFPRRHEPHITLIHPRNATCTDTIFHEIQQQVSPQSMQFRTISLIEQSLGEPWEILKTFELKNTHG